MNRFVLWFVLCLNITANTAFAQQVPSFNALVVKPNPAFAGQLLQARSIFNRCVQQQGIGATQQSVSGSVITLTLQMSGQSLFCLGVPPPPALIVIDIGSFPAGNYTLVQQPVSPIPNVIYAPLSTTFTVAPQPIAVPVGAPLGMLVMVILVGLAANLGFSLRRQD